ncbi:hypothetical protein BGZ93_010335 [Podila epicladia]|nr:hypothetical protein BGZ92_002219 [Podila epicladia]KAG0088586.1 hypothetical protein BGZ93_010335 [Podila epicladia]
MSQCPSHNATTNTLHSVLTSLSKGAAHSSFPQSQGNTKDVPTPTTNQSATAATNPSLSRSPRLNSGGPPQFRSFLYAVEIPVRKKPFQPFQSSSHIHSSVAAHHAPTIPRPKSNSNEARSPNASSSPVITRGLAEADRNRVADHSAARGSGAKEKKRNEKYFSDDARAKLLAAFTKNNYPDNDVKDQLAAELNLTPTQVTNED